MKRKGKWRKAYLDSLVDGPLSVGAGDLHGFPAPGGASPEPAQDNVRQGSDTG